MNPQLFLISGTANRASDSFTITANLYDLDVEPDLYQKDGSGNPILVNGMYVPVSPLPSPLPEPLLTITQTYPLALAATPQNVATNMQYLAADALRWYEVESGLGLLMAQWQQTFVPVTPAS